MLSDLINDLNSRMTYRQIAEGLNICIVDPDEHYSQTAIWTWGKSQWSPGYSMLEHIHNHAPEGSWMRDFAAAAMEIKTNKVEDITVI